MAQEALSAPLMGDEEAQWESRAMNAGDCVKLVQTALQVPQVVDESTVRAEKKKTMIDRRATAAVISEENAAPGELDQKKNEEYKNMVTNALKKRSR